MHIQIHMLKYVYTIRTNSTRLPPSADILGNESSVHPISCLCGMGCKRTIILEMEDRITVYLIIYIYIRLYIAKNKLHRDVNNNHSINTHSNNYTGK